MTRLPRLSLLLLLALVATVSVSADSSEPDIETATFAMYCYWTGEATVGRVDGVVASRIGHWGGREIVQVDFDPHRTNVGELAQALGRQRSFDALMVGDGTTPASSAVDPAKVSRVDGKPHFIESKHSLRTRHPELLTLDLSEAQAMALNSWSYFGGPMPDVLTDEQKRQLGR